MAYRIAICDDNDTDADYVQRILNSWAKTHQISI